MEALGVANKVDSGRHYDDDDDDDDEYIPNEKGWLSGISNMKSLFKRITVGRQRHVR